MDPETGEQWHNFARAVRRRREAAGLNISEAARATAGVRGHKDPIASNTWNRLENLKRPVAPEAVQRISRVVGLDPDEGLRLAGYDPDKFRSDDTERSRMRIEIDQATYGWPAEELEALLTLVTRTRNDLATRGELVSDEGDVERDNGGVTLTQTFEPADTDGPRRLDP